MEIICQKIIAVLENVKYNIENKKIYYDDLGLPINTASPVVSGNRASIFHFNIEIKFLWKHQADPLIEFLIENSYPFEIQNRYENNNTTYILIIKDICWANNLSEIVKILEKCDYQDS